jgi:hypothetical protein
MSIDAKTTMITAALAAATAGVASVATAGTWPVTQDAWVYQFLGNQGAPDGDSEGVLVWNHESNHGAKGLLQVDAGWTGDPLLAGPYTATLHLYQVCEPGDFVGACPGDPGAPSITTDLLLQNQAWTEADAGLVWAEVNEDAGGLKASIVQTSNVDGWIAVDVTALVEAWRSGTPDFGFSLSQEAYPVVRADNGSVAVAAFCDSESSTGVCATGDFAPRLEIASVADADGDGVNDSADNCTEVANADQRDTNGDGYGNICDPDLDDNGNVNFTDLGEMKELFFSADADADLNGDGSVNFLDLGVMKDMFFGPPGPSGVAL